MNFIVLSTFFTIALVCPLRPTRERNPYAPRTTHDNVGPSCLKSTCWGMCLQLSHVLELIVFSYLTKKSSTPWRLVYLLFQENCLPRRYRILERARVEGKWSLHFPRRSRGPWRPTEIYDKPVRCQFDNGILSWLRCRPAACICSIKKYKSQVPSVP